MVTQAGHDDFDEDDCLCQGKVPTDKRIDFEQVLPSDKDGRRLRDGVEPLLRNGNPVMKWFAVLRFHKDCPIHGITIMESDECRVA